MLGSRPPPDRTRESKPKSRPAEAEIPKVLQGCLGSAVAGEGQVPARIVLLRNLVSYQHTSGAAGTQIIADLATDVPTPTNGGKTYTFQLKDNVMFGDPINRPITSKDIAFQFERIATKSVNALYGFYYDPVIEGMQNFADRSRGAYARRLHEVAEHLRTSRPTAVNLFWALDRMQRLVKGRTEEILCEVIKWLG